MLGATGCSTEKVKATTKRHGNTSQKLQQTQPALPVKTGELQYYFTKANQHPDEQLIKVINSSKSTLDIAIYSLTKKSIVNAIIQAKDRKVNVRIMTDKIESKSKAEVKELALLQKDNIPIKANSHPGLLHIKMTIADKNIATTGSYNYTENASTKNDEILVIINDSKVAEGFDSEFENMWNDTKDYEDYN
ncbi:PLD-like domain-containing protein [Clostridium acidisoli DSM 12555]|uniref:phospholipase D n=1 Tax=Clostridium acidisoli DSM 12555 TaxID=1121291 RepID=A0A1W1X137_9CLOT|nr:phospholipase D-like domain-containing protein [Clostridium acidisoli]SMC17438.1 PLD-like domain-containing protein [Clostridium acidisoli DSM 12555]